MRTDTYCGAATVPTPGRVVKRLVISNKIVVDHEYVFPPAEPQERIEFTDQLRRRFRPRTTTVDRYDVAKFARKRTAPRKLDRHECVFVQCQKVETRDRRVANIRLFRNTIQSA